MKKVLVTGGAGFIGSHVVDLLVAKGYFVRIYDNLDPQVHGENAEIKDYTKIHLESNKAEFIKGDVKDYETLKKYCLDVDYIIHLAAAVGVGQSMYKIKYYVDTNCSGTGNLLDILINNENSLKKIIVASSMSIYGEGSYYCNEHKEQYIEQRNIKDLKNADFEVKCPICNKNMKEIGVKESKKLCPTSVYAVTKKDQEELVMSISKAYKLPAVALRFFNVYGKRQSLSNPYTGAMAIFSSAYLNSVSPIIYEDGFQSRDFIHVKDLSRAIVMCLENEKADYEIFNVGSGENRSIKEIAEILSEKINPKIKPIITKKFRAGDIRHCFSDSSKIKEKINFKTEISLEEGILELTEWVKLQKVENKLKEAIKEIEEKHLTI
jgi:dTDP-L-rhamnose 4-epimerase